MEELCEKFTLTQCFHIFIVTTQCQKYVCKLNKKELRDGGWGGGQTGSKRHTKASSESVFGEF